MKDINAKTFVTTVANQINSTYSWSDFEEVAYCFFNARKPSGIPMATRAISIKNAILNRRYNFARRELVGALVDYNRSFDTTYTSLVQKYMTNYAKTFPFTREQIDKEAEISDLVNGFNSASYGRIEELGGNWSYALSTDGVESPNEFLNLLVSRLMSMNRFIEMMNDSSVYKEQNAKAYLASRLVSTCEWLGRKAGKMLFAGEGNAYLSTIFVLAKSDGFPKHYLERALASFFAGIRVTKQAVELWADDYSFLVGLDKDHMVSVSTELAQAFREFFLRDSAFADVAWGEVDDLILEINSKEE